MKPWCGATGTVRTGWPVGLAGSGDDAMDATQKAFLRVWKALPRFRAGDPFYPWLYRIVRNCALNQRRDEKRHRGDVPLEFVNRPDGRPSPLDEAAGEDLRRRLWDEIQMLSVEQREVLVLHQFQGLKYREIAAVLEIPMGTVMSRLHAARTRLARRLDAEEGHERRAGLFRSHPRRGLADRLGRWRTG